MTGKDVVVFIVAGVGSYFFGKFYLAYWCGVNENMFCHIFGIN